MEHIREEVRETVFTIHAKWIAIPGLIISIAKTDMRLPIAKLSLCITQSVAHQLSHTTHHTPAPTYHTPHTSSHIPHTTYHTPHTSVQFGSILVLY